MFDINLNATLTKLAIAFVPVMLGIILHEVAHGWVAARCGDKTAQMLGRITLNPIPHIDPVGLAMFVITAISPGNFIFGWAKPVPVNPRNYHSPRRDDILVSLAGVTANFLLAIVFALALRLLLTLVPAATINAGGVPYFLFQSFIVGVQVNLVLVFVNLLPVPPLDGSHVVAHLLPRNLAWKYMSLGRYGFIILLVLLATGIVRELVWPPIAFSANLIFSLLGL